MSDLVDTRSQYQVKVWRAGGMRPSCGPEILTVWAETSYEARQVAVFRFAAQQGIRPTSAGLYSRVMRECRW